VRLPILSPARHLVRLLEQTDEARLLEVMVRRDGFRQTTLLHNDETGAVDQAPILVET
jgi:hypothetical protein